MGSSLTGLGGRCGAGRQLNSTHVYTIAYGMNLGRMLVRMNVRVWNKENVANGMIDTTGQLSLVKKSNSIQLRGLVMNLYIS